MSNDDLIQAKNAIQNFQIMTEIHCEKLMRISVDKELDKNSEQICWALKLNTLKIKSISNTNEIQVSLSRIEYSKGALWPN